MRLYFKGALMHIRSAMQYPASFAMLFAANLFFPLSSVFSIYFLFERFGQIKGYAMEEVLFCYSVIYFGFAVTEAFLRGFDLFSNQIRQAGFDRILTRPRSAFLQTAMNEFAVSKLSRGLVALVLIIYSVTQLDVRWDALKVGVLILAIAGALSVYAGLMILRASLCFWTVEGLEITNIVIDGGKEAAAYPIDIYSKGFAVFFTYVVPFACVNYYPMLFLLEKTGGNLLCAVAPLAGILFLPSCLLVWRLGVRHYESTGS